MKKSLLLLCLPLACVVAQAKDVYVQGYTKANGTYVQPHYQTAPDSTIYNNYSTQGNYNPYTGQTGTVAPYPRYQTPQPLYQPMPVAPAYQPNNYKIQPLF